MSDKLLNDSITSQIREAFSQLKKPVEVLFFGSQKDCPTCGDTRQLAEEVTAISDSLGFKAYDLETDQELAKKYHVSGTPAMVIAGRDGEKILDYGIRLLGIPSGHEFSSFIHDLILVSGRDSGLDEKTRKSLKKISKPVHLQVFVTPT